MNFELTNPVYNNTGRSVIPIAFLHSVNTAMNTNPPTLNWYLGIPAAGLTYETQCPHVCDPAWSTDTIYATSSNMSYTFTSTLSGGVQYAWKVRSVPGATQSDWSTKSRG